VLPVETLSLSVGESIDLESNIQILAKHLESVVTFCNFFGNDGPPMTSNGNTAGGASRMQLTSSQSS
jgi:hypothetical protein